MMMSIRKNEGLSRIDDMPAERGKRRLKAVMKETWISEVFFLDGSRYLIFLKIIGTLIVEKRSGVIK